MSMEINKETGGQITEIPEYCEGFPVEIGAAPTHRGPGSRLVVRAYNEAGHNQTNVDLEELLAWVWANRPDLILKAQMGES